MTPRDFDADAANVAGGQTSPQGDPSPGASTSPQADPSHIVADFRAAYVSARDDAEREAAIDTAFDAADAWGDAHPDAEGRSDDAAIVAVRLAVKTIKQAERDAERAPAVAAARARDEAIRAENARYWSEPANAARKKAEIEATIEGGRKAQAEWQAFWKIKADKWNAEEAKFQADYAAKCKKWADDERAERAASLGVSPSQLAVVQAATERYKFVAAGDFFFDAKTYETVGVMPLERRCYHLLPIRENGSRVPSKDILLTDPANIYDAIGYRPYRASDEPVREYKGETGQRTINAYRPPTLRPVQGDASAILDHIKHIFSDPDGKLDAPEFNFFMQWLAFMVQHPAQKQRQAVVIKSKPGVGKGTIADALVQIVGPDNIARPRNESVIGGRNTYLDRKRLVVINELRIGDRRDVANALKEVISEPTIEIDPKFINPYTIENPASLLCFTNHDQALYIEPDDRRYFVYVSKARKKSQAYFIDMHGRVLKDPAILSAFYWDLLHWDLAGYDHGMHAPMTASKADIVEGGKGDLRRAIEDAIDEMDEPFRADVVSLEKVQKHYDLHNHKAPSLAMLGDIIENHGGGKCNGGQKVQFSKTRKHLWFVRDPKKWSKAPAQECAEEYVRGQTNPMNGFYMED